MQSQWNSQWGGGGGGGGGRRKGGKRGGGGRRRGGGGGGGGGGGKKQLVKAVRRACEDCDPQAMREASNRLLAVSAASLAKARVSHAASHHRASLAPAATVARTLAGRCRPGRHDATGAAARARSLRPPPRQCWLCSRGRAVPALGCSRWLARSLAAHSRARALPESSCRRRTKRWAARAATLGSLRWGCCRSCRRCRRIQSSTPQRERSLWTL